jgi:predicted nucleic acid-binding protein
MIAVDTDVLVIHRIFQDDPRHAATADFVARTAPQGYGVPIFSLLELCGVMATAKQSQAALLLLEEYLTSATVQVLYPPMVLENVTALWAHQNAELVKRIRRGMRLGDAAILWTVESTACDALVTWNVKHYRQKTTLAVLTPDEWLTRHPAPSSSRP